MFSRVEGAMVPNSLNWGGGWVCKPHAGAQEGFGARVSLFQLEPGISRESEQRNLWVFIPSQSVHLILTYSSQIFHVPLGPVMIYGLGSSNTLLDSF